MSENFDELGELGDKIKKIIDTAVSTKDYRQMTEDIKQTDEELVRNSATGAETLIKMGEKIGEKCQKEPFSGEN